MLRQIQGGPSSPDSPLHVRPLRMTFVMGGNSVAGSWHIEIKSVPFMKEESEKAGFKFNIQKTKIIVFGPIT